MKRLLLVYRHFGPYHRARWQSLRASLPALGLEPVGLQVFARAELHDWGTEPVPEGVTDLALPFAARDRLRWGDASRVLRALSAAAADVIAINGWGTREAWLAHAWCRWRGVARVVVADSVPSGGGAARFRDVARRSVLGGVGGAFVAGTPQRRYLEALGVPVTAIRQGCNAVDNAHFAVARTLRRTGGHRLLTVARFSPEKNLLAAARAFLAFCARRPVQEPWRWRLVGHGPEAAALQAVAEASKGRIEVLGRRDHAQLPQAYADADLYWQPSLRDTWALPVNEAMASGLPVLVSTRCGCSEDLVTPATGWQCDPASEATLCTGLQRAAVAHADWPTMGAAAAAHIEAWGLDAFVTGLSGAANAALSRGARA